MGQNMIRDNPLRGILADASSGLSGSIANSISAGFGRTPSTKKMQARALINILKYITFIIIAFLLEFTILANFLACLKFPLGDL